MTRWMRSTLGLALILAITGGWAAQAQARVTEKVDALIAENTPLKVNDNDLWVMGGGPLVIGLQYDKYATQNLALGIGVGCYGDEEGNGTAVDLALKYYFLPGKFSPFLAVGPVIYYNGPHQNVFAMHGTAGLAYFFHTGFGLSLGAAYVQAISESEEPFHTSYIKDEMSWLSPQFGLHWNF